MDALDDKETEIKKLKQQLKDPKLSAESRTDVEANIKKYEETN